MTIEVDASSFRTTWVRCSHGNKMDMATSVPRETGGLVDDVRFAELQARVQRLHASFDAWCKDAVEEQEQSDMHALSALAEINRAADAKMNRR
ncbi:MAG: hypothetical protein V4628_17300 [Pseudomonadota bacterium]